MNILVIGNGFDLAHGLKTSYEDFINFYRVIADIDTLVEEWKWGSNLETYMRTAESDGIDGVILASDTAKAVIDFFEPLTLEEGNAFIDKAKENFWLQYVQNQDKNHNEKWCYFEELITIELEAIAWIEKNPSVFQDNDAYQYRADRFIIEATIKKINKLESKFQNELILHGVQSEVSMIEVIGTYREELLTNLKDLIYLLDIYISKFLTSPKESKSITPFFCELNVSKVINFNYTNTYWSLYHQYAKDIKETDIHFIHGQAQYQDHLERCLNDKKVYESNMVLGVGTSLRYTDTESQIQYAGFQKYFQRIIKKTGVDYIQWLKEMDERSVNNIIIYGHSLDVPDGDMIKQMEMKSTNFYIFYYDDKALSSITLNLVKVFGQNKVIELTNNERLNFISCQLDEDAYIELAQELSKGYVFSY